MIENNVLEIFPTKISRVYDLDYPKVKENLINEIIEIKNRSENSNFSNVGGWHSKYYIPSRQEKLFSYENNLYNLISKSIEQLGFESDFYIKCIWFNVNFPGNYNMSHVHPGSNLSGVFYVKVPKNSGFLYFENQQNKMNPLQNESSTWIIDPVEGELILFNSAIPHGVYQNNSNSDRISIAFNINFLS